MLICKRDIVCILISRVTKVKINVLELIESYLLFLLSYVKLFIVRAPMAPLKNTSSVNMIKTRDTRPSRGRCTR